MIPVDLHCHSHFSLCGLHSILELLTQARTLGMTALAITDHGPALGGRLNSSFFDRLYDPVPGIRMLKGCESNILDETGTIDFPESLLKYTDILLAGFHVNFGQGRSKSFYTDIYTRMIAANPAVDIISHPTEAGFLPDFRELARVARQAGVALEINNSKLMYDGMDPAIMENLIRACRDEGCRVAVNSDTHAIGELGRDDEVFPLLTKHGFPPELVVNGTAERAFAFIEERRKNKVTK